MGFNAVAIAGRSWHGCVRIPFRHDPPRAAAAAAAVGFASVEGLVGREGEWLLSASMG